MQRTETIVVGDTSDNLPLLVGAQLLAYYLSLDAGGQRSNVVKQRGRINAGIWQAGSNAFSGSTPVHATYYLLVPTRILYGVHRYACTMATETPTKTLTGLEYYSSMFSRVLALTITESTISTYLHLSAWSKLSRPD